MRKIAAVLVIIFSLSMIGLPVFANNKSSLQNKKSSVDSRINNINQEKKKALEEKKNLESQKSNIQNEQQAKTEEYQNIVSNIDVLQENLKEIEAALLVAEENYARQEELFKTRINVMYQNSNTSLIQTIIESNSITDFFQRMHYMSIIAENDKTLVEELECAKKDVECKRQMKEDAKQELERQAQLKKERIEQLNVSRAAVDDKLLRSSTELKNLEKQEDELKRESERIKKQINELTKKSNSSSQKYAGGTMTWPAPSSSRISSPYGMRTHPILKYKRMHSGIDISAKSGTSIVAANSGTVIVSGYNAGGYGNYLIVDHGGGITSLYAHCSKLLVSKGAEVKAGDVIAKVGSTGLSTGPHLHFEVRKNGSTVNPMNGYLSK